MAKSAKTDKSIVRNAGKMATQFEVCERHNERQNIEYKNADIIKERAGLNIQYRRVFSSGGTPETYEETFNRLLAEGKIVKKGLKADAKVFGELVFDINTAYFDRHGGYDYAKKFYDEVYRYAVKEVGSEDYILSAVMHADERNKALSDELGRDVYHYHLHVIYIPVVRKEVYYQKTNKDPALAGKLKEVIPQISHSKKWPIRVPVEREGKTIILNEYSLLQDRFYEHMRSAGFEDFERGERGSTAEHLSVLEYKSQQEAERLSSLSERAEEAESALAKTEKTLEKKQERVAKLDEKIDAKTTKAATVVEIDAIGHSLPLVPGLHLTDDEAKRLKSLAKATVKSDERIAKAKRDMVALQSEFNKTKAQLRDTQAEVSHWHREYTSLWNEVKDVIGAI
ncbi:plasmid recombination protein [Lachnospiraceae bacterium ZAX-1]